MYIVHHRVTIVDVLHKQTYLQKFSPPIYSISWKNNSLFNSRILGRWEIRFLWHFHVSSQHFYICLYDWNYIKQFITSMIQQPCQSTFTRTIRNNRLHRVTFSSPSEIRNPTPEYFRHSKKWWTWPIDTKWVTWERIQMNHTRVWRNKEKTKTLDRTKPTFEFHTKLKNGKGTRQPKHIREKN